MKIGYRNFTSFEDFMIQLQEYALERPLFAAVDLTIVLLIILAISSLF